MAFAARRLGMLALALSLPALAGCREGEQHVPVDVTLADGGYALVRIEVPGAQDARFDVTIDAAPSETFYALLTEDDPPRHVGWFDMTPYAADAESCAASDRHESRCNPEGAGYVVATTSNGGTLVHDLGHCPGDSDDTCIFYVAVVGKGRLATTPHATVTVTTRGPGLGEPARVTRL